MREHGLFLYREFWGCCWDRVLGNAEEDGGGKEKDREQNGLGFGRPVILLSESSLFSSRLLSVFLCVREY